MFGMPCRFLNGHMLVGVFQDSLMLHLDAEDRAACIRAGAKPFTPMGREMKGYVAIEPWTFDDHELKDWIVRGMRYLGSLPPKGKINVLPEGAEARRGAKTKPAKAKAPKPKARARTRSGAKPKKAKAVKKATPKKKPAKKGRASATRKTARKLSPAKKRSRSARRPK
jgi:hypothetical protein